VLVFLCHGQLAKLPQAGCIDAGRARIAASFAMLIMIPS
jgi:hypothetical protein